MLSGLAILPTPGCLCVRLVVMHSRSTVEWRTFVANRLQGALRGCRTFAYPLMFASLGFVAVVTGCSGGGGNTTLPSGSSPSGGSASPTPRSSATPSGSGTPTPSASPTPGSSGSISYDAKSACINHNLLTNNVLPPGVGEFATNGLEAAYWGATHSRSYAPAATWPGYESSWGRFQYDTYFGNPSDGSGLTPFSVVNDTAAITPTKAVAIVGEPEPSPIASNLKYAAGWTAANLTTGLTSPPAGGSLTMQLNGANLVHTGWNVGIGAPPGGVTREDDPQHVAFYGQVTEGGCSAASGPCTGGSSTITISNIVYSEGGPGVAIPNNADVQAWNFIDYYSGVLDTNVNQQYGFFVARIRLPQPLPALSPAWWMLETGGVGANPKGSSSLLRSEWDVEEQFANDYGYQVNAGNILWSSGSPSIAYGCGEGCPSGTNATQSGATGVYPWTSTGNYNTDYHDYGVTIFPACGGTPPFPTNYSGALGGVYVENNNPYCGTTYWLDGQPIPGHIGGPDLTQGSPDKEIMLMFQISGPGWLDPKSAGPSNPWPQYMMIQWLRVYQPTKTSC